MITQSNLKRVKALGSIQYLGVGDGREKEKERGVLGNTVLIGIRHYVPIKR